MFRLISSSSSSLLPSLLLKQNIRLNTLRVQQPRLQTCQQQKSFSFYSFIEKEKVAPPFACEFSGDILLPRYFFANCEVKGIGGDHINREFYDAIEKLPKEFRSCYHRHQFELLYRSRLDQHEKLYTLFKKSNVSKTFKYFLLAVINSPLIMGLVEEVCHLGPYGSLLGICAYFCLLRYTYILEMESSSNNLLKAQTNIEDIAKVYNFCLSQHLEVLYQPPIDPQGQKHEIDKIWANGYLALSGYPYSSTYY